VFKPVPSDVRENITAVQQFKIASPKAIVLNRAGDGAIIYMDAVIFYRIKIPDVQINFWPSK